MKRLVPFIFVFGLITGLSCSSDDGGGEAASMTKNAEAPAATDESDTVDLTMQSDLDGLEERIQELEDQLANLPAGPAGPQGPAGPAGADGAQGPAGPAGADGADGAQGPAGANGTDGADGAAGATGDAGAVGATGAAGADGVAHDLTCADGQVPTLDNDDWSCGTLTESRGATLYHPGIPTNCCDATAIFAGATTLSPNLSFDFDFCDDLDCSVNLTDVTDHTGCFVTGSYGGNSIEANMVATNVERIRIQFGAGPDDLDIGDPVYFNIDCGRTYTIDAD